MKTQLRVVTEEWRSVVGFPRYEVSSLGRVRSWLPRTWNAKQEITEPHILKATPGLNGYARVSLASPRGKIGVSVHRLVLEAFVGPCPTGMVCRHFPDRDKTNNALSNLSWGTQLENSHDKRAHGTQPMGDRHWARREPARIPRGEQRGGVKLTDIKVREIKSMLAQPGVTCRDVAELFGLHRVHVNRIKLGRIWSHVS
jgi:hypothetical protein